MSTALAHHHVAAAGGGGGGGGGGGYDTSGPAGNGVTNGHGGTTPNSNSSNDIKQVQVTTHLVAIILRFDVSFSNRPKEKDAHMYTYKCLHTYVLGMPNFFFKPPHWTFVGHYNPISLIQWPFSELLSCYARIVPKDGVQMVFLTF